MPSLQIPGLEEYAEAHTTPEPGHLARIARETIEASPNAQMMIGPMQGRFMAFLVAAMRARNILEIGTFTGYSAIFMAEAMPPGGRLVTLDFDAKHVAMARANIAASPVADRITVIEGPALQSLQQLAGSFDFVFIDADKAGLLAYYEAVLPKLTDNGMIAVDNVFRVGDVLHEPADRDVRAIQEFNDFVVRDPRVECVMLTVRDGLTLIRRR